MIKKITNIKDFEAAMNSAMLSSIKKTQERVYNTIQNFIIDYYEEYAPSVYERTKSFFNSLTKSKITKTGNGYICEVYIDMNKMDYYRHEAIEVVDMINRGFHADKSMDGGVRIHNGIYNDPYYAIRDIQTSGNMHFWDDSIEIFKQNNYIINCFIDYMNKEGFNIKKRL